MPSIGEPGSLLKVKPHQLPYRTNFALQKRVAYPIMRPSCKLLRLTRLQRRRCAHLSESYMRAHIFAPFAGSSSAALTTSSNAHATVHSPLILVRYLTAAIVSRLV